MTGTLILVRHGQSAAGTERTGKKHHVIQPRASQLNDVMQERTIQAVDLVI
jgi:broad specificity phosphatase PhoE